MCRDLSVNPDRMPNPRARHQPINWFGCCLVARHPHGRGHPETYDANKHVEATVPDDIRQAGCVWLRAMQNNAGCICTVGGTNSVSGFSAPVGFTLPAGFRAATPNGEELVMATLRAHLDGLAEDLRDVEDGHENTTWSVEQLLRYLSAGLALAASPRRRNFAKRIEHKLVPGGYQKTGAQTSLEVLGVVDKSRHGQNSNRTTRKCGSCRGLW